MTDPKTLKNMTRAELWRKFWWVHPPVLLGCAIVGLGLYHVVLDLFKIPSAVAGFEPLVTLPTFKMAMAYLGGVGFILYPFALWIFFAPRTWIDRYRVGAMRVITVLVPVYLVVSLLFGLGAWYFLTSTATHAGYRDCGAREFSAYGPVSVMWGRDEAACRAYCAEMSTKKPRLRCPAD